NTFEGFTTARLGGTLPGIIRILSDHQLMKTANTLGAFTTAVLLTIAPMGFGSIIGPYAPDTNTILLLHLDEPGTEGITTNAVAGAASFVASANPSAATPRNPTPGLLGATGASGIGFDFGRCADLTF